MRQPVGRLDVPTKSSPIELRQPGKGVGVGNEDKELQLNSMLHTARRMAIRFLNIGVLNTIQALILIR